jgi:hypothetical protein
MLLWISVVFLIMVLIGVRVLQVYLFIKKVSKVCADYDWKHIDHNTDLLLEWMKGDDFYMSREWSAYNFMFMKGPNPLLMFFSLKPLTIRGQYTIEIVERLGKYNILDSHIN